MTPARRRKLAKFAARPDSEIDFSDIPPLKESFWKNAVRNPFYRPVKQQLTVRLDADVVAWLRRQVSLIANHRFYRLGLGWVDAHLLASALLARCEIYTRDRALAKTAQDLAIAHVRP